MQTKLEQKYALVLVEFRMGAPHPHVSARAIGGHTSGNDGHAPRRADDASIMAARWTKIKYGQKPAS